MRWLRALRDRRRLVSPRATYVVQLHRATTDTLTRGYRVLSSWEPITVVGTAEDANRKAQELRAMNRWGNATEYPLITVNDPWGSGWLA